MFFPAYYKDHLACELIGYVILSLWIVQFPNSLEFLYIDTAVAVHHRKKTQRKGQLAEYYPQTLDLPGLGCHSYTVAGEPHSNTFVRGLWVR